MEGIEQSHVPVINSGFCVAHPTELTITKNPKGIKDADFAVTDADGDLVFKISSEFFSIRDKQVIADATGTPIVLVQRKLSCRDRWKAFMGNSTDEKDLLFSVRRSSMFQFTPAYHVFLAANVAEEIPDFKIKGSLSLKSCTFYKGEDSSIVAAQMYKKKDTTSNFWSRMEMFGVTVNPNIDSCFVVSLVTILRRIAEARKKAARRASTNSWTAGTPGAAGF